MFSWDEWLTVSVYVGQSLECVVACLAKGEHPPDFVDVGSAVLPWLGRPVICGIVSFDYPFLFIESEFATRHVEYSRHFCDGEVALGDSGFFYVWHTFGFTV